MGSTFSCSRADKEDHELPPRPVNRNQTLARNGPKIVHVHNRALRQDPHIPDPAPNMAREGAGQRIIPPPPIIDLVSDDEDDDLGNYGSPFNSSPSPAPPAPFLAQQAQLPMHQALDPPNAQGVANDVYLPNIMIDQNRANNFQDFDDFDVQDAELERAMFEQYNNDRQRQAAAVPENNVMPVGPQQENIPPVPALELRATCIDQVAAVFPGICHHYVSTLYDDISPSSDGLIAHILDKMERGDSYPSAKEVEKSLKRKRTLDEDEEATRKYGAVDRKMPAHVGEIRSMIRTVLSNEFPETPMIFVDACLASVGNRVFFAYRVLEEAHRTYDEKPAYNKMKTARKVNPMYREEDIALLFEIFAGKEAETEILHELQAARRIRKKADAKREAERQLVLDEEENVRKAEAEGTMQECGCCFGDYPLNRMIHCNSEKVLHFFCRGCARQTAETEIGASKYQLHCMSMDGCKAGFSIEQRSHFLDENTIIALGRNEQEAVLRMAGIENLASCPFCPYAAEYPPVEIDREFRCQAPDCEKVSCRLCKLESHIPKSCAEHAKENGLSIRRQIEEAMSAALIRKCNKCQTPFVKEEGCNKMTCTRNGCRNVQCYVCSQNAGYDHFNDTSRGGKTGNCPLFESVEQRHEDEVNNAEKAALDKARAEHPEYTEEDLKVKMSDRVKEDEERRKSRDPAARLPAMRAAHGDLAGHPLQLQPHVPRRELVQLAVPLAAGEPGAEQQAFERYQLLRARQEELRAVGQVRMNHAAEGFAHRGDNFPPGLFGEFAPLPLPHAHVFQPVHAAPAPPRRIMNPEQAIREMLRQRAFDDLLAGEPGAFRVDLQQAPNRAEQRLAEIRAEVQERRRNLEYQALQLQPIHPAPPDNAPPAAEPARNANRIMMGRLARLGRAQPENVAPIVEPRNFAERVQALRRQGRRNGDAAA